MEGANWPGWISLLSFALAFGTLVKNRVWPDSDDLRTGLLTECVTAIVASVTVGSLPKLFGLENALVRWGTLGVSAIFTILAWVQLVRVVRLKAPEVDVTTNLEG